MNHPNPRAPATALTLLTLILSSGLAHGASSVFPKAPNLKPAWLGPVTVRSYDGVNDDLLTAGLGKSGLGSPTAPAVTAPNPPTTPAEAALLRSQLRRLVIHTNYRALIDTTANGGYGRLYGPNIDLEGNDTLGEGMVAGTEYLAFARNVAGVKNVTLLVQVPAGFNPARPCIVAAPSSGSRGVYGAIGTTGEWALKRGCAVAYTDKGTGAGGHDLDSDRVTLIDGTLSTAAEAGGNAYFAAELTDAAAHPHRYAMKHAHSGDNPERVWGKATLKAVEFAFDVLNEQFGKHPGHKKAGRAFNSDNTLVIAASVSNGGGAILAAAEEDHRRLIDGVVAVEPQINMKGHPALAVSRGGQPVPAFGLPLYDYITFANLYQPCAAVAPSVAASPFQALFVPAFGANRCAALAAHGLVTGGTVGEQAENALAALRGHGWEADSDLLHLSHYSFAVAPAVSLTYANAFRRARVTDNLCGYSMATTDTLGAPSAPASDPMPTLWSLNNGVPPSTGINLVAEGALNGPIREQFAQSASTALQDYNHDGAACLRDLLEDETVQESIEAIQVKGDLGRRPTLILHGRADNLVPVNHASRPYLGLNSLREGRASRLSYIEVSNAQHFEAFLPLPGYDTRFIPLHYYGGKALDLMWAHLTKGAALPPSQVVRTIPRGGMPGTAPAITTANLPAIASNPAAADRITVSNGAVNVPD